MTANGAVITMEPQMTTQNLVMYRLNRMIMPSMAKGLMELLNKQKDRFSTFINLIQSSGMANTLEQGNNKLLIKKAEVQHILTSLIVEHQVVRLPFSHRPMTPSKRFLMALLALLPWLLSRGLFCVT